MEVFAISVAVLFLVPGVCALAWAARTIATATVGAVLRIRTASRLRPFVTDAPVDSTSVWLSPSSARSAARAVGPHVSLHALVGAVLTVPVAAAYCWPLVWGLSQAFSGGAA